jgi:hypothetical protein
MKCGSPPAAFPRSTPSGTAAFETGDQPGTAEFGCRGLPITGACGAMCDGADMAIRRNVRGARHAART